MHSPFVSPTRPCLRLAGLLSLAWAAGCGGTADQVTGPDACASGKLELKRQLGPELGAIAHAVPLPIGTVAGKPTASGCALVYTRVPEESPEELPEEDRQTAAIDQGVAVALPDGKGRTGLTLLSASEAAPGPVGIEASLKDLNGDGQPELLLVDRAGIPGAGGYKGLRVVAYGTAGTRVQLDTSLVVKTAEGLDLMGNWQVGKEGDRPAVLIEGGGVWQVYAFNPSEQRFALDPVATARRNPNRAPPATTGSGPKDGEVGSGAKTDPLEIDSGSKNPPVGSGSKNPPVGSGSKNPTTGTGSKNPATGSGSKNPPAGKSKSGGKSGKARGGKASDAPDPNVPQVELP